MKKEYLKLKVNTNNSKTLKYLKSVYKVVDNNSDMRNNKTIKRMLKYDKKSKKDLNN